MAVNLAAAASTITIIQKANFPFWDGLAEFVLHNFSVRDEYNTWFCKAIRLLDHTSLMQGFCGSNKSQISAYRLELFDTIPPKLKKSFADIIATYGGTKADHLIHGGPGFDKVDDADLERVIGGGENESVLLDTFADSDTSLASDIAPAGGDVSVKKCGFLSYLLSPIATPDETDYELDVASEENTAQQLVPQHEYGKTVLDLSSESGSITTSVDYPVPKKPKFQNISVKMHNNAIECLSNACDDYWKLERKDDREIIRTVWSIEIDVRKFKTLAPNHYLCDDVIDCHFQMLRKAMNKPAERELIKAFRNKGSVPITMKLEVLVYSAQFIAKIFTLNGRNSFEYHVWLPTLSIMTYNYLLIPVNIDNHHWVLIVIRPLYQPIELYDSIGGNPTTYFEPLKNG